MVLFGRGDSQRCRRGFRAALQHLEEQLGNYNWPELFKAKKDFKSLNKKGHKHIDIYIIIMK